MIGGCDHRARPPGPRGNALPYPASAPLFTHSAMSTTVASDYGLFTDCVKGRCGFWAEAKRLGSTATWFRHALAVADETRRNHE